MKIQGDLRKAEKSGEAKDRLIHLRDVQIELERGGMKKNRLRIVKNERSNVQ